MVHDKSSDGEGLPLCLRGAKLWVCLGSEGSSVALREVQKPLLEPAAKEEEVIKL
jgi:hypothetical protein